MLNYRNERLMWNVDDIVDDKLASESSHQTYYNFC